MNNMIFKLLNKKIYRLVLTILMIACTIYGYSAVSFAVDALTTFGSASYEVEKSDESFPIGVYIKAGDVIGTYHLEVAYDSSKLRYVSGALMDKGGVLVIEGVGGDVSVRNFLYFQAIDAGSTNLTFVNAAATNLDGTEMYNVVSLASAPVTITDPEGANTEETNVEETNTEETDTETELEGETEDGDETEIEDVVQDQDADEAVVSEDTTDEVVEATEVVDATEPEDIAAVEAEETSTVSAPSIPNNQQAGGNRGYLLVPFIAVLSLLLVVIGVVVFIINLKRKRFESASVNTDIKYDFEFETFAEDSKTITAEEVEEKLAKAEDGELHTIDIETLSSDEYGDIDYLE